MTIYELIKTLETSMLFSLAFLIVLYCYYFNDLYSFACAAVTAF